ncbi:MULTISPECIES: IS701 family transposase [Rhodopseudomonas]|uniref:Transposase n=1 Tax=Rhodopseudomonas palustris TaxID=1076 RepID=A0A0D7EMM8_RHOPL|nr:MULTISPECIES: IS701 family transposase [Rhodopseudomonas]KIZ42058.1 transposase [Rhodopseudomonas palustris]MDF3813153.1 IS701 family transposase [Rhodopseudomonas sp. BAL398]WOK16719.1 IS701 family transposase [Rhodopseudomonas sp. BAL398]
MESDWRSELEAWLAPFVAALRNKTRGRMCPAYIAGLIGPGDRKSVQPMAARDGEVSYDRLHHFIGSGIWDEAPLETALLAEADSQVGGEDAWLIIDDTTLPKKGSHSVGVAPQYASALGKNANCQTLVSLTLASREVPVMVGLRLFLPESWTSDLARLDRAGVPDGHHAYRTKPEIALAEIDRVRSAGVRFGCVLADAGYGLSGHFRQGLSERGLTWAVGIPFKQKVYPADVTMIFPVAGRGRPRKNAIPDITSVSAQTMLEAAPWRKVSWRRGTKGRLSARFAAIRVRVADGPPQRIHDMGAQHLPGEEVWLIGEHRSTGERKYYLSNLPGETPIKQLAGAIKARWICEQAHQQLKEELGLDHFEGRSWKGLHRHALLSMIAFAFLQFLRLKQAKGGKKRPRTATAAEPSQNQASHH